MATYKVIQDIEAEDKLIGPFGIRQFIYLIIVAVSLFVGFNLANVAWFLVIPLLPHTLFFGLLALPFGGQQPTETWLLAKIRFAIKPRRRVWNQSGLQNLVTITVPKKVEKVLTNNMSQTEVRSRLEALANTIDSRGWAIKNVNPSMFNQPVFAGTGGQDSDRLVAIDMQSPAATGATASDDILDEQNNPTAQNLERMISASSKAHRDKVVANMKRPDPATIPIVNDSAPQAFAGTSAPQQATQPPKAATPQPGYWFMDPTTSQAATPQTLPSLPGTTTQTSNLVTPDPAAVQQSQGMPLRPLAPATGPITEEELLEKIHADKQHVPKNYGNMRVIKTLDEQQAEAEKAAKAAADSAAAAAATAAAQPPVTPPPDPAIIGFASNDDLDVATIARQANKSKEQDASDGEVVINLH
jgi:hypothetical protein